MSVLPLPNVAGLMCELVLVPTGVFAQWAAPTAALCHVVQGCGHRAKSSQKQSGSYHINQHVGLQAYPFSQLQEIQCVLRDLHSLGATLWLKGLP